MDNKVANFYFKWLSFRIGDYHPVEFEPIMYNSMGEEVPTKIVVPVPFDPLYVNEECVLTKEGAEFCIDYLRSIHDKKQPVENHDEWDLEQADKADNDNFDEMFNS